MFFIFFNVIYDGPSDLDFCEKVKISQYKKHLATLLKILSHHVLVNLQIVFVFWINFLILAALLNVIVRLEASVSKWKNIISDLNNK